MCRKITLRHVCYSALQCEIVQSEIITLEGLMTPLPSPPCLSFQIFQPYAKYWLPGLVQLIVGGAHGGEGLHYFVVDLLVTILSWSTTTILEVRRGGTEALHCLQLFYNWSVTKYATCTLDLFVSLRGNCALKLSFLLLSLQDEYLANRLLEYLMEHSHHDNRSVFRNNLEIIKTLVECWREKLQGPTK